uniref:EF-hand domain-containing protein n=1 Tax=Haptolina brevifila TaxID=156173 RepID=A0A7S2N4J6_9EUKA
MDGRDRIDGDCDGVLGGSGIRSEGSSGGGAAGSGAAGGGAAGSAYKLASVEVNWSDLCAALPAGRDAESILKRQALFAKWDVNSNGCLSFNEVDSSMRELMGKVMGGFLRTRQHGWAHSWKPVIRSAVRTAKGMSAGGSPYVDPSEFRLLLLCMLRYFEVYVAFCRLDVSCDRRIDFDEFKCGLPALASWGVHVEEDAAAEEFEVVKGASVGHILFDDFLVYANAKGLCLDDFGKASRTMHRLRADLHEMLY